MPMLVFCLNRRELRPRSPALDVNALIIT